MAQKYFAVLIFSLIALVGCVQIEYGRTDSYEKRDDLGQNINEGAGKGVGESIEESIEENIGNGISRISPEIEEKSRITKISEVELEVPEIEKFEPKVFSHPQKIKFAFIEVEPTNSEGFELTKDKIEPLVKTIKTIFEEITGGIAIIDKEYIILQKKKINLKIEDATDQKLNDIADEITKENGELNQGILVLVVDAPFSFYVGSNLDKYVEGISPISHLSGSIFNFVKESGKESEILLKLASYRVIHEMLHSYEFGRQRDAYTIAPQDNYPFVNYKRSSLYGISKDSHPFGPAKVQNGWKKYRIIYPAVNEEIKFKVSNTCLPASEIVKIPQGYILSPNKKLFAKSIVFDLKGKHKCIETEDPPGIQIHGMLESYDDIEYSYSLPFHKNPSSITGYEFYVFALNYYGKNYAILHGIKSGPLKEYSSPEFSIRVLNEEINNGNIDSMDVAFTLKQKETVDASSFSKAVIELLNYDNKYLIFRTNFEKGRLPVELWYTINGNPVFTYFVDTPTNTFCIIPEAGDYDGCAEAIKKEFGDEIMKEFGEMRFSTNELSAQPEIFDACTWTISVSNNIAEKSATIHNYLNPKCSN